MRKYYGEDTAVVRDGKPRRYAVLSFDDNVTQDGKVLEILRKNNIKATFNINTGLFGVKTDVSACYGKDVLHQRYTENEVRAGLYDGMDICSHGLKHIAINTCSRDEVIDEAGQDAENIEKLFGKYPRGFVYAYSAYNENAIRAIIENTDMRFARTGYDSHGFGLPEYFMAWNPTFNVTGRDSLEYLQRFVSTGCSEDMLMYAWGHSYELDLYETWDTFEQFVVSLAEARDRGDVTVVTDEEFYHLFKDDIPSWK